MIVGTLYYYTVSATPYITHIIPNNMNAPILRGDFNAAVRFRVLSSDTIKNCL